MSICESLVSPGIFEPRLSPPVHARPFGNEFVVHSYANNLHRFMNGLEHPSCASRLTRVTATGFFWRSRERVSMGSIFEA
jgi:hypothetical protein